MEQQIPSMFADYVRKAVTDDPVGFSEIRHEDAVLYIANGVKDPKRIKQYIDAGIGPKLAGDMEFQSWD